MIRDSSEESSLVTLTGFGIALAIQEPVSSQQRVRWSRAVYPCLV